MPKPTPVESQGKPRPLQPRSKKSGPKRKAPPRAPSKSKSNPQSKSKTKGGSKKTSKGKSKTEDKVGRATILPSSSVHHNTPEVILEGIVYPVFGGEVDLDPCSNATSIVRAKRAIKLPDDGLAVDWKGNVMINPPYGSPEIDKWIAKAARDRRRFGAQVIGILPASMSAEWMDTLAVTCTAAVFWGPGLGNRRVKFGGNKDSAAFHSLIAYWGDDPALFIKHGIRYGHPWFPQIALRLSRAYLGEDQMPEAPEVMIAHANDMMSIARHDDLAAALSLCGGLTIGELLAGVEGPLRQRLLNLRAFEVAAGLMGLSRGSSALTLARAKKGWTKPDPRQLSLVTDITKGPDAKAPKDSRSKRIAKLDENVYAEIVRYGLAGTLPGAADLAKTLRCTKNELRRSLERLVKAKLITKEGTTRNAKYVVVPEHGAQAAQQ